MSVLTNLATPAPVEQPKLIIPISAKAQHGKDTVAEMLKRQLEQQGRRVLIMHFADYLKFGCAAYKNWDGVKNETGRTILQTTGTEEMRKKYPDFWVMNICWWISGSLYKYYDVFILPDARFPNEINRLKTFPFDFNVEVFPVRVTRLGFESPLTPLQQVHESETALDKYNFNYGIFSKSGLEFLEVEVQRMIEWMRKANII